MRMTTHAHVIWKPSCGCVRNVTSVPMIICVGCEVLYPLAWTASEVRDDRVRAPRGQSELRCQSLSPQRSGSAVTLVTHSDAHLHTPARPTAHVIVISYNTCEGVGLWSLGGPVQRVWAVACESVCAYSCRV
eukprot:6267196-Prymnesium_polylepis.1